MHLTTFALAFAVVATAVGLDLNSLGNMFKDGMKAATGADICDSSSVLAGIPFCPIPGAGSSLKYCCTPLFGRFAGRPSCCDWVAKNMMYILIGAGVGGVLLLIGSCVCCYCCCGKSQPGQVVIMPAPVANSQQRF